MIDKMLQLMERYSQDNGGLHLCCEMRTALVQLAQIGLQFNEAKSDNPFAYYTATVNNSFTELNGKNVTKQSETY